MFVTPLFAAVLGLLYVLLAFNVIRFRIRYRVAYGESDNIELIKASRIHANFGENVPFALFLMWMVESMTLSSFEAFWLGSILLIGRVLHVVGMAYPKNLMICRQIGVLATLGVIVKACITLLMFYIPVSV
ncbi:MAPEG family protein [Arenicella xantha]|uniref:Glutathione S-transferase n=1 Tax=Arenicella xantha TaxID=644221 RepID=A0A395JK43_9GAMM|nr:MAPEG family protein [Arenicella xantha]RBP50785.1 hypothetical protein DFR28_102201 [Arenicella xantha]